MEAVIAGVNNNHYSHSNITNISLQTNGIIMIINIQVLEHEPKLVDESLLDHWVLCFSM